MMEIISAGPQKLPQNPSHHLEFKHWKQSNLNASFLFTTTELNIMSASCLLNWILHSQFSDAPQGKGRVKRLYQLFSRNFPRMGVSEINIELMYFKSNKPYIDIGMSCTKISYHIQLSANYIQLEKINHSKNPYH